MSDDRENERRRYRFFFRVFKVMVYAGAYLCLRYYNEIGVQNITLSRTSQFRVVSANPQLPYWRRQVWRALFSLPMVVEEEGLRAKDRAQGVVRDAQGVVRDAQERVNQFQDLQGTSYSAPQGTGRQQAVPVYPTGSQPAAAPRQGERVIYTAPPAQAPAGSIEGLTPASSGNGGFPGLAPGEQVLYVAPPGQGTPAITTGGNGRR